MLNEISGLRYKKRGLSEFAQAMPDTYKVEGNPVLAYRKFYIEEKMHFARWTKRDEPYGVKEMKNSYNDK
ncbi:MAG: hypothetical protein JW927_17315 [Deltaproteobacteria bacterium]|nr:hypothetical protein [Deltaproteobacteria bacterium]